MSTTEPLITHIEWHGNTCTVGRTNFGVRVNPDGLDAIYAVDSDIYIRPWFDHTVVAAHYLHRFKLPKDSLATQQGFRAYYEWDSGYPMTFSFDINCRLDSPLIGWFLVLGAKDERSSDTRRRHEQILNDLG